MERIRWEKAKIAAWDKKSRKIFAASHNVFHEHETTITITEKVR